VRGTVPGSYRQTADVRLVRFERKNDVLFSQSGPRLKASYTWRVSTADPDEKRDGSVCGRTRFFFPRDGPNEDRR